MTKEDFFLLVERAKASPDYAKVELLGWELKELIELSLLARKQILGEGK